MTSYSSSKEEIEVASTVQPFEEDPRASNKGFDKDSHRDKDSFTPVVLRSRLEKKVPLLNFKFIVFVFYLLWRNLW